MDFLRKTNGECMRGTTKNRACTAADISMHAEAVKNNQYAVTGKYKHRNWQQLKKQRLTLQNFKFFHFLQR